MKIKELFKHTNATFDQFCNNFKVVTEFNCSDMALVCGFDSVDEFRGETGINPEQLEGHLIDIGAVFSYGSDAAIVGVIGHVQFAALCRLREENQKEALSELDVEDATVMFETGGRYYPTLLLEYLQPGGEGGTQVSLEDWTIWHMLGLVEDIRGWDKFWGHPLYTGN